MFYKKKLPHFSRFSTAITNRFLRGNHNAAVKAINPMLFREFYKLSSAKSLTHIYADTCTLLHNSGMELLDAAEKVFSSTPDQHLLILTSVLYELQNVARKDPTKNTRCRMILDKLNRMHQNNSVKFIESNSPEFSDAGFISHFVTESQTYDVVLLTQDRSLANKVTHLPSFLDGCVNSAHSIRAFRLTTDGNLAPFVDNQNHREEDYHEKLNVRQPLFFRAHKARTSAPCTSERWHAAVYCTGESYPRFYAKTDSDECTGSTGG